MSVTERLRSTLIDLDFLQLRLFRRSNAAKHYRASPESDKRFMEDPVLDMEGELQILYARLKAATECLRSS